MAYRGSCFCGAVRFEATGAPKWVSHCHCRSCQRATGSPMTTFVTFLPEQVNFTGTAPKVYHSTPGTQRAFCADCGTRISFTSDRWPGELHLHLVNFEAPEAFQPQTHVFWSEKLSWLHIDDDLSKQPGASQEPR